jgi:hypothetical protein
MKNNFVCKYLDLKFEILVVKFLPGRYFLAMTVFADVYRGWPHRDQKVH